MGSRSKVGSFARGVTPLKGGGAVCATRTGGVACTTRTGAVLGLGKPAVGPATSGTCVFVTRRRRAVYGREEPRRWRFGRGKRAEGSGADGDGALLFFGGSAASTEDNRTLCSAINRSMRVTSDGGKTCLTRSMSSSEVMVFDFLVTEPNDLKQQSIWYQRVLGEWP